MKPSINQDLMLECHISGVQHPDLIESFAEQMVREIQLFSNWSTYVKLNIKPDPSRKNSFEIKLSIFGLEEHISIEKKGKNIYSLLRKTKKIVLKRVKKNKQKKMDIRKTRPLRDYLAS